MLLTLLLIGMRCLVISFFLFILSHTMLMDFQIFYVQYVHYLQRKYSLSSFNLLGHTAPAQAGSLLLLGPFLDYWLTNNRVDQYAYDVPSTVSSD
jgi:uncharacterized membrane protein YbhN (UPF0104 family)